MYVNVMLTSKTPITTPLLNRWRELNTSTMCKAVWVPFKTLPSCAFHTYVFDVIDEELFEGQKVGSDGEKYICSPYRIFKVKMKSNGCKPWVTSEQETCVGT